MIPEIRVGEEAMRRLWLVEVGVDGVVVPVPVLDSEVLTAGAREASPNPGGGREQGGVGVRGEGGGPPPIFSYGRVLDCEDPSPRICQELLPPSPRRGGTCDGAGGWSGMQGHVGLGDGLRVEPRDLLQFGEGHDGLAAFGG